MKREPIKTPFLSKSKDSDYQESLALFKLILRFMNDSNLSGKRESVLGDYIVNKVKNLRGHFEKMLTPRSIHFEVSSY